MKCEHLVLDAFPNILDKSKYHKLQTPIGDCEFHTQSISIDKEKKNLWI